MLKVPTPVLPIGTKIPRTSTTLRSVESTHPCAACCGTNGGFLGQVQRSVVLKVPIPVLAITIKRGIPRTSATLRSVEVPNPVLAIT